MAPRLQGTCKFCNTEREASAKHYRRQAVELAHFQMQTPSVKSGKLQLFDERNDRIIGWRALRRMNTWFIMDLIAPPALANRRDINSVEPNIYLSRLNHAYFVRPLKTIVPLWIPPR